MCRKDARKKLSEAGTQNVYHRSSCEVGGRDFFRERKTAVKTCEKFGVVSERSWRSSHYIRNVWELAALKLLHS